MCSWCNREETPCVCTRCLKRICNDCSQKHETIYEQKMKAVDCLKKLTEEKKKVTDQIEVAKSLIPLYHEALFKVASDVNPAVDLDQACDEAYDIFVKKMGQLHQIATEQLDTHKNDAQQILDAINHQEALEMQGSPVSEAHQTADVFVQKLQTIINTDTTSLFSDSLIILKTEENTEKTSLHYAILQYMEIVAEIEKPRESDTTQIQEAVMSPDLPSFDQELVSQGTAVTHSPYVSDGLACVELGLKVDAVETLVSSPQASNTEPTQQVTKLQGQLDAVKYEYSDLAGRDSFRAEQADLENALSTKQEECSFWRSTSNKDMDQLKSDVQNCRDWVQTTLDTLMEKDIKPLNTFKSTMEPDVTKLKKDCHDLQTAQKECEGRKNQYPNLKSYIEGKAKAQLDTECAKLKSDVKRDNTNWLKKSYNSWMDQAHKDINEQAKKRCAALKSDMEKKTDSMETTLRDLKEEIGQLKAEWSASQKQ